MPQQPVTRYGAARGARIYCLPVRAFPALLANVYVVIDGAYAALVDTGSGGAASNADLAAGFVALAAEYGEPLRWEHLQRIVVTHGHVDHYGGIGFVRERSAAPIAVHALDAAVVRNPAAAMREQVARTTHFLLWAGVDAAVIEPLATLFVPAVRDLAPAPVATVLEDRMRLDERFDVLHTPGHCAGQVCVRLDDILFCADHMLAVTNPRLTPARLEPGNGLAAYFAALDRVAAEPGLRMALAGHEAPIQDVYGRVAAIRAAHASRLEQIVDVCVMPRTIAEIAAVVYPDKQRGVGQLITAQAIAARVEYLVERGQLHEQPGAPAARFER
jgi:glyoxylase-like metal-dependent hydrolase (beta-lactamase superfamily II)